MAQFPNELKQVSLQVARVMFPAAFGQSIEELASIIVLFPNRRELKSVIRLVFMFIVYISYIVDGFFFPFVDTHFLPLPRGSLGPINHVTHILYGCALTEFMTTRIYISLVYWKTGRSKLKWYTMSKGTSRVEHPKMFSISRFLFAEVYFSGTFLYVSTRFVKMFYERSLLVDIMFNCIWIINNILFVRFTFIDLPLLYMIACDCYFQVKKLFCDFNRLVHEGSEENDRFIILKILSHYEHLMKVIPGVNQLIKLLMFQNNFFIIPYFSGFIVLTISQTENWVQMIMKCAIFAIASVFSVRGVILTAVLARIDCQNKILYKNIASIIAREKVRHCYSKIRLQQIMDDLSCNRNHLLMREYTGKVTQMDVCRNLIGVVQFTMLFLEFGKSISHSRIN